MVDRRSTRPEVLVPQGHAVLFRLAKPARPMLMRLLFGIAIAAALSTGASATRPLQRDFQYSASLSGELSQPEGVTSPETTGPSPDGERSSSLTLRCDFMIEGDGEYYNLSYSGRLLSPDGRTLATQNN